MIKYFSILLSTIKNHENITLRYFNDISLNIQATTSAIAGAAALDQGERFQVLVQVVTPSQRQDIAFPNLY
jgi:hypothetical protein